jgi:hypothetical protein
MDPSFQKSGTASDRQAMAGYVIYGSLEVAASEYAASRSRLVDAKAVPMQTILHACCARERLGI